MIFFSKVYFTLSLGHLVQKKIHLYKKKLKQTLPEFFLDFIKFLKKIFGAHYDS